MISAGRLGGDSSGPDVSRETVAAIFGGSLLLAEWFAEFLTTAGVQRGLIGPHEAPRLWTRHLLNSAALSPAIAADSSLIDVGSGAGLPGLVLALLRDDLRVTLVEPMKRRVDFLNEAVAGLGLVNVTVRRARAEELSDAQADVVTARAVAPLATLAGWCLPLVAPGGALLAIKGATAAGELSAAEPLLKRLGARQWGVEALWAGPLTEPTTVVRVIAGPGSRDRAARRGRPAGMGRRRRR